MTLHPPGGMIFDKHDKSHRYLTLMTDYAGILGMELCVRKCHVWSNTQNSLYVFVSNREDDSRQQLTTDSTHVEHQNRENSAPGGPGKHRVIRQAVKDHSHEVREARKQVTEGA